MTTQAVLRRRTMQRSIGLKGGSGATMAVCTLRNCFRPSCQFQWHACRALLVALAGAHSPAEKLVSAGCYIAGHVCCREDTHSLYRRFRGPRGQQQRVPPEPPSGRGTSAGAHAYIGCLPLIPGLGLAESEQSAPAGRQNAPTEGSGPTPPEVRANQLAGTVEDYRRQAIADGLPFR